MSCTEYPPPKGDKCLECWQCNAYAPKSERRCGKVYIRGPAQSITTCEAASSESTPTFSTQAQCDAACGTAPPPSITCYLCNIQPGQKVGECAAVHPTDKKGNYLKTCPDWNNMFATDAECKAQCKQGGHVVPVPKCWVPDDNCVCTEGLMPGVKACDPTQGSYATEAACVKGCKEAFKPLQPAKTRKLLSAGIVALVGAVVLAAIVMMLYLFYRRRAA